MNCEEGEESDYARADPILSALKEESDGVFRNILGPTRAKGLEFPAVVIYRFAETAPSDFLALLKGEIDVFSFGADGQPGGEGKNAEIGSWQ